MQYATCVLTHTLKTNLPPLSAVVSADYPELLMTPPNPPSLALTAPQVTFSAGQHSAFIVHNHVHLTERPTRPCLHTLASRNCPICRAFFSPAEITRVHIDFQPDVSTPPPVVERLHEEVDLEQRAVITAKTCGSTSIL